MVLDENSDFVKKKRDDIELDDIKTLVSSTIQRKWPEKRPGALRQRNKIKGWTRKG